MVNVDQKKIIDGIKGSPHGSMSVFVKIDSRWAIKLYYLEDERDKCFQRQKQAAEYGLGPDVGEKVNFAVDCSYPYGYITEIVEVCVPHEEIAEQNFCDTFDVLDGDEEHNRKAYALFNELETLTGIYYIDNHPANIGIKNGRYVLIDFGC